jgi:hypothetical protein
MFALLSLFVITIIISIKFFDLDFKVSTLDGAQGPEKVKTHVINGMHNFNAEITAIALEDLEAIAQEAYDDIYNNFPVGSGNKKDDGSVEHTRDNILFEKFGEGRFEISYTSPVVTYLEFGTSAHGPVTAKALHFFAPDGTEVFAKRVRGIPPHYIILKALLRTRAKVQNIGGRAKVSNPKRVRS